MTIYFKFKKLLTTYGLPNGSLKLGNEHFWPNHVMACDNLNQGNVVLKH
jgi:hypothetical protein